MDLSLEEAQLFRLLRNFFGQDRVVLRMSILAACGGELPNHEIRKLSLEMDSLASWAKSNTCFCTIVDAEDNPKLVVDFGEDFSETVDITSLEYYRRAPQLLAAAGVKHILMSQEEFKDILTPGSSLDLVSFLEAKFQEANGD